MDQRPEFLAALGLLPPCTPDDVKQAFLHKVKAVHPDRGGTREQFIALEEHYQRALEYAQFFESRRRWIGSAVERFIVHEACLADVARWGGHVELEQIDWLIHEIGEDFAQLHERIVGIDLSALPVGDAELETLAQEHLASLSALRRLDLSGTLVTDEGLEVLLHFVSLQQVALDGTDVGGAVRQLAELPRLNWLGVRDTRVGWLTLRHLKKALPDLAIGR
ncbi:MAG: J domain-containing protein [Pirellulales bacterium]|nr:J domain-containing protein [Pirellulales bacterium]